MFSLSANRLDIWKRKKERIREVILSQRHCPTFLQSGRTAGTRMWNEDWTWGAGGMSLERAQGTGKQETQWSQRKGCAVILIYVGIEVSFSKKKVKLEKFNFHLDPSLIILITLQSCICILNMFKCSTSFSKVILQVPYVLSLDTGSLAWSRTH